MSITSRVSALTLAVLVAGGLAACSSDSGESAEQKAADAVCDDRAALEASIQKVGDELSSANFGAARDELDAVKKNFDDLLSSVGDLAKERADDVQPAVDDLKATIDKLTNAKNFGELGTALDDIGPRLEAVVEAINTSLDCDNADKA